MVVLVTEEQNTIMATRTLEVLGTMPSFQKMERTMLVGLYQMLVLI
jgi:hypothetical protein